MIRFAVAALLWCIAGGTAGADGGFIRIREDRGVWWFVDGAGQPFFSLGVDCVGGCYGHAEEHAMEPGRRARIASQMGKWGFDTAACWSSPSLWPGFHVADQIYVRADLDAVDVWDEELWTTGWVPGEVRSEVAPFLGLKNFIGYFVDNEPHWDPAKILRGYCKLGPSAPGSRALVAFARQRYPGGIRDLNREWGTRLASFEAIPGTRLPKKMPGTMGAFLAAWRTEVVKAWYTRYVALVRAADPDHLILGVRWAGLPDLELYKALSPLFDVNSVNDYSRYGALAPRYAEYYEATRKPVMITEYSFSGFPEPGHKSLQFVDVFSQENRARGYAKFVTQAARAPFMVGMHWFLWADYDKQDEEDGGYLPDENMGLVSADESVVYGTLVDECARTNAAVPGLHRQAARVESPVRPPAPHALVRMTPGVDGDLSEWPAAASVTPWVGASLIEGVDPGHRYWLAADGAFLYLAADIRDTRLDDPGVDWCWEGDYLALYATPPGGARDGATSIYVFPTRGGKDHRQPYAGFWGDQPVGPGALAAKRATTGGYTLEVRLPLKAVGGGRAPAGSWTFALTYRNVSDLYDTWWEGLVAFPEPVQR